MTPANIRSGFIRAGVWDPVKLDVNIEVLEYLFKNEGNDVTLKNLPSSYTKKSRSLLNDVGLQEIGTVRVDTSGRLTITSEAVLSSLAVRDEKRKEKKSDGLMLRNSALEGND